MTERYIVLRLDTDEYEDLHKWIVWYLDAAGEQDWFHALEVWEHGLKKGAGGVVDLKIVEEFHAKGKKGLKVLWDWHLQPQEPEEPEVFP